MTESLGIKDVDGMLVKKADRLKFETGRQCIVYEYPIPDKSINIALVEVLGRYPENGRVINEKVKELIFVETGNGELVVDDKTYKLESEDSVLILPGQKYYWKGNLKLVTACSPAWYPEQHKTVDR